MRVYIAGPITGHDDLNRDQFAAAARLLRTQGHEPVNPLELHDDLNAPYAELVKTDIKALLECDAIRLLPDWKNSRGAKVERKIARLLGLKFIE